MSEPSHGIVVGLVGPVCTGKSLVASELRSLGAGCWDADEIVHELYLREDVKQAVGAVFGENVFAPDGSVDRSAIARRVFATGGDDLLKRLTDEIIFPRTGASLSARIDEFRNSASPNDVLLVDAPTLVESDRFDWCDHLLLVTAPLSKRTEWARDRGWEDGEVERRDAAMIPESRKKELATYVIANDGTKADLLDEVRQFWRWVRNSR